MSVPCTKVGRNGKLIQHQNAATAMKCQHSCQGSNPKKGKRASKIPDIKSAFTEPEVVAPELTRDEEDALEALSTGTYENYLIRRAPSIQKFQVKEEFKQIPKKRFNGEPTLKANGEPELHSFHVMDLTDAETGFQIRVLTDVPEDGSFPATFQQRWYAEKPDVRGAGEVFVQGDTRTGVKQALFSVPSVGAKPLDNSTETHNFRGTQLEFMSKVDSLVKEIDKTRGLERPRPEEETS